MALARAAKQERGTLIVAMVDNYLRYMPKQLVGALFFRLNLRPLFDYMWVPGKRSATFMRFLGMPRNRVLTGLYSADHELFYPPEQEASRNGVVFVGQFIGRKGVDAILDANIRSPKIVEECDLRLFGHGPLTAKLLAAGLRVEPFAQPRELGEIYRKASALLLPSKLDHWGVVLHEAAACGCFLLATRQCAGVDDLIKHGVNGFIMRASNPSEISRSLAWLKSRTAEELTRGRSVSIALAAKISPALWAHKLAQILPPETRSANGNGRVHP